MNPDNPVVLPNHGRTGATLEVRQMDLKSALEQCPQLWDRIEEFNQHTYQLSVHVQRPKPTGGARKETRTYYFCKHSYVTTSGGECSLQRLGIGHTVYRTEEDAVRLSAAHDRALNGRVLEQRIEMTQREAARAAHQEARQKATEEDRRIKREQEAGRQAIEAASLGVARTLQTGRASRRVTPSAESKLQQEAYQKPERAAKIRQVAMDAAVKANERAARLDAAIAEARMLGMDPTSVGFLTMATARIVPSAGPSFSSTASVRGTGAGSAHPGRGSPSRVITGRVGNPVSQTPQTGTSARRGTGQVGRWRGGTPRGSMRGHARGGRGG